MIAFLGAVGDVLGSSTMYESMMRFAIVLAFAAVGEWVAERAGTLNISVEAMLIGGAFTGAVVYGDTNNTVLGLLSGIAAGGISPARTRFRTFSQTSGRAAVSTLPKPSSDSPPAFA